MGAYSRYVTKRVVSSFVTLLAVSIGVFVALRVLPGDPITSRLGNSPGIGHAAIDQMRRQFGLDRPLVSQYLTWIGGVVRGDFGKSYSSQTSVGSLIASALPPTVELTITSIILSVAIALPVGILSGSRPNSTFDRVATALSTAGMAFPPFLLGIVLILLFSVGLAWVPARGFVPLTTSVSQNLVGMILPSVTLALVAAPLMVRFLRASMIEVLNSTFVRTAQGKGLGRRQVVMGHALQNALIPGLTMLGLIVGYTLGGVVVIEYVFGFSGLGSLAVRAVSTRDYPILEAVTLLISAMFILTTLVVDLSYGWLDPRLRVGRGSAGGR
jgi:peptide/nickel transport system permease protein